MMPTTFSTALRRAPSRAFSRAISTLLPSTTADGRRSRLVPVLESGAGVVITRADVHVVVTEYGVAPMLGRSLRERAEALIAIAHPDFRDELRAAARRRNLL